MKAADLICAGELFPQALVDEADRALEKLAEVVPVELWQQLPEKLAGDLGEQLVRTLACSNYCLAQFQRHPQMLVDLIDSGDLLRPYTPADFRSRVNAAIADSTDEDQLSLALRQLRQREMCRLIWRDMNRASELFDTTAELSALADACIDASLDWLYADMCADIGTPKDCDGNPQRMVVLGMGKLGAGELNLSSDIDLMFTFPSSGETEGGRRSLSNQEFFIRLGRRLIKVLDAHTGEGFVFRTDMRLRPYGDSGALALGFDAMLEYYQDQGREWERYAMIKARVVAGDMQAGESLMVALNSFVYRRYVDFSAIESLRDMKALINREVQRRGLSEDVKLGAGGIREVEFIAQAFQLIRGGRDLALQTRSIKTVLGVLEEKGLMPGEAVAELEQAYVFLRNTEHAIQGIDDAQTQSLPAGDLDRARIAAILGFADWNAFSEVLAQYRSNVRKHFEILVASGDEDAPAAPVNDEWLAVWLGEADGVEATDFLTEAGYQEPQGIIEKLANLRESKRVLHMQKEGRERLDAFLPLLLKEVAASSDPDTLLLRVLPLTEAVLRRTAYLVLMLESDVAREQLYTLCGASPWIADQLTRNPVLLDELHNVATLYQVPDTELLRNELREQVTRLEWQDLEGHMQALRYFRLAHVLRIAASEVTDRMPLMRVSDYLTYIAEVILDHVLQLGWHNLVDRHGEPEGSNGQPDFIVIGYGKLGGIELGHGSDLDMVFIHGGNPQAATGGDKPIAAQQFHTRLGQRMIHILETQTTMGRLYEVDMRLRPDGDSGMLVASLNGFERYQQDSAWTWEHQALVRARVVAGSASLAEDFNRIRHEVLAQPRDIPTLRTEVREMRSKMRDHLLSGVKDGVFDLKHGHGGIVDIEFMVQFAVLAWAHLHPALTRYSDNIRILESLAEAGLLTPEESAGMTTAYKAYRAAAHRLALQQQKGQVDAAEFVAEREMVSGLWHKLMEAE